MTEPRAESESASKTDPFDDYLAAAHRALQELASTQRPAIEAAAERFASTIRAGRLVHVFGTGHSRMAVEEMFPRYGSFPGFHPIVELSMTYHNVVVGANGQRQAMFLENVQGFGAVLWRNFDVQPPDGLLAISTSGCNAATIDVALEAKQRGLYVVALTAQQHSDASESKHHSGQKLADVADLVLDQRAPAGDSVVWLEGMAMPIAPLSSVTGCAVINLLKVETARRLTRDGQPPTALVAACHVGADRAREIFDQTYDDYRRRVGILYR